MSTRRPYRQVLATPGARRFVPAALVGRLPMSMIGLGTVLLVQDRTGSYGLAGAVSAAGALAQGVTAPGVGRLLDQRGQARVVLASLAVHVVGMVTLLVTVAAGLPPATWFLASALAGAGLPQLGICVRVRWSVALAGRAGLTTAYALESVLDEVVFIVGPVLVTSLAIGVEPEAALSVALGFAVVGALAFVSQTGTDPGPRVRAAVARPSVLRHPGVSVLAGSLLAAGAAFSALEVTMVAFARARHAAGAAGLLLALVATGSMLSGLAYGARAGARPPFRRFPMAVVAFAAGVLPLLLVGDVAVMAPTALVAGSTIAPMLISGFALAGEMVPGRARTEGLAWVGTAIALGVAVGAPAAGWLVDRSGSRSGFALVAGCGAVAATVAWTGRRAYTRRPDTPSGTVTATKVEPAAVAKRG